MDLNSLIELGSVGAFVIYALLNNREWRAYLSERNSKIEKSLDKISVVMEKHSHELRLINSRKK